MTPSSVLLITPRWTRDGGVGAHVKASAAALAEHGVEVSVVASQIDPGEVAPGVTLHLSPQLFDEQAPLPRRLGGALERGPELVHLHQVDRPDLAAPLRELAPLVNSAHAYTACPSGVYYFGAGEECTRGHGPGCVPNLLFRGCAHTRYRKTLPRKYVNAGRGLDALRTADLAVSYSTAVDRHLAANGLQRRAIVPYFPTMPAHSGSGHAARRRVVFAGRIVRPKGVAVLIHAAALVDAEFVLCGDGRELERMRALAERLGVAGRIRFAGWLDEQALAQELADASLVVVPSLWPEPFGLVGIEAFAAGRPAVASATGGIGDWLEHGVSGLVVQPGDIPALARALNELLDDPERQERMGRTGMQAVQARFSPERHVEVLLDAYRTARAHWQERVRAS